MKDAKIPAQYQLMGQTYTVKIVSKADWTDEGNWGFFDPQTNEISVLKLTSDRTEHGFYHELVHTILTAMGHKLNGDENFVDMFAGLLHNAIKTSK